MMLWRLYRGLSSLFSAGQGWIVQRLQQRTT